MTLGPRTKLVGAPRTHALPGRGGGPRSFAGKALFCGTCRREWACGGGDVERARTHAGVRAQIQTRQPRKSRRSSGRRGRLSAVRRAWRWPGWAGWRKDAAAAQRHARASESAHGCRAAARELQDPESSWRLLSRIVVSARLRSAACLRSVSMYPGAREGKQARGRSGAPVSHRMSLLMSTFTLPLAALARRWGAENGSNLRQGSA